MPDPDRRASRRPHAAEVPLLDHREEAAGFVDPLAHEAEPWVDPVEVPPTTGDPKDEELVAFHRNCQADLLISGDADLLDRAADDVTVLTPRELLERLRT